MYLSVWKLVWGWYLVVVMCAVEKNAHKMSKKSAMNFCTLKVSR